MKLLPFIVTDDEELAKPAPTEVVHRVWARFISSFQARCGSAWKAALIRLLSKWCSRVFAGDLASGGDSDLDCGRGHRYAARFHGLSVQCRPCSNSSPCRGMSSSFGADVRRSYFRCGLSSRQSSRYDSTNARSSSLHRSDIHHDRPSFHTRHINQPRKESKQAQSSQQALAIGVKATFPFADKGNSARSVCMRTA
jgi:hypothetical protein